MFQIIALAGFYAGRINMMPKFGMRNTEFFINNWFCLIQNLALMAFKADPAYQGSLMALLALDA